MITFAIESAVIPFRPATIVATGVPVPLVLAIRPPVTAMPVVAVAVVAVPIGAVPVIAMPVVPMPVVPMPVVPMPVVPMPVVATLIVAVPVPAIRWVRSPSAPVESRRDPPVHPGNIAVAAKMVENQRTVTVVVEVAVANGTGSVARVSRVVEGPMRPIEQLVDGISVRATDDHAEIEAAN
jgi:hypothetical protein